MVQIILSYDYRVLSAFDVDMERLRQAEEALERHLGSDCVSTIPDARALLWLTDRLKDLRETIERNVNDRG